MATIGPNRACSCIIESKLFTQTKFSKNWGKTKEIIWEAPLYLFIYLFLNHEFHIWNIAILTDSCLSLFFKICYRFMTITVHHFLEMFVCFFFFKKTSVFLKKIHERHWTGKEKTIVNTTFSDCVHWAKQKVLHEKARLCGQHRSRKAGVRDCSILGSLSEQDRAGLPGCHTGSLLMRAAPDAFCTEVGNFSLCDK